MEEREKEKILKSLDEREEGVKSLLDNVEYRGVDVKLEEGVEGAKIEVVEEEDDDESFLSSLSVKDEEFRYSLGDVELPDKAIEALFEKLGTDITDFSIPEGCSEVERYFVNEPYVFVSILYNNETDAYLYHVVEPRLSDEEKFFLADISERLRNILLFTEIKSEDGRIDKEKILREKIDEVVLRHHIELEPNSLQKISYYIVRDFVNFGKIEAPMCDRFTEDVSCDGYNIPIYVYHWKYGSTETNIVFDERELDSFVMKLAQKGGKHLSYSDPMVDITMQDGSRGQLTLGSEITTRGSTFTIRRFREVLITPADLIRWGTFTAEQMAYLWLCVWNGKSILFIGGTASGKTTSLNAISLFIPENSKIITIEDTRELKLPHKNWIPSVTRHSFMGSDAGAVGMYDLLKAALRQRPEYLIVGEVRGQEAITLFQAMSTGHTSFSTLHADSVDSTIHRLEYPPLSVPRSMMQALDVFAIQSQVFIGKKRERRNFEITENLGIDPITKNIKTMKVFEWIPAKDSFTGLGASLSSKILDDIAKFNAWSKEKLRAELETRKTLLTLMAARAVTPEEFIAAIRAYQVNPEKVKELYGI